MGETTAEAAAQPEAVAEDCPISESELSDITGLDWVMEQRLTDHPLETNETVSATVCLFTTGQDEYGDPYSLRTDVVSDADAPTIWSEFESLCADNSGSSLAGADGQSRVCDRNGSIIEGVTQDGVVSAYVVNADAEFAAQLTPVFDQVLSAMS